jgi:hypothetical protein
LLSYDDARESFIDYQKIELKDIEKLELGPASESSLGSALVSNLFGSSVNKTPLPSSQSSSAISSLLSSSSSSSQNSTNFMNNQAASKFHILRVYYRPSSAVLSNSNLNPSQSGSSLSNLNNDNNNNSPGGAYFHSFRSSNLRFFNNLVITTKSNDELTEALRGICHTIQSTASFFGFDIPFEEVNKMAK